MFNPDHGKTTLVDAMLQQSSVFRDNEQVRARGQRPCSFRLLFQVVSGSVLTPFVCPSLLKIFYSARFRGWISNTIILGQIGDQCNPLDASRWRMYKGGSGQ